VTLKDDIASDPDAIDLFVLLRAIERGAPDRPRIGKSRTAREDAVTLGQEPFVEFPGGNVSALEQRGDRAHVTTRFLGLFGPQGALPLATTLEALAWRDARDPSFLRFTEIFSNRFLQLFFRAWADARPIAQHDRPDDDRFALYLGALAGLGTPSVRQSGIVPDEAKIGFAGLVSPRVKTPAQLALLIHGVLDVTVRVVERVPSWLVFDTGEQTAIGRARSSLGRDTAIGARMLSLSDKIAVEIRAASLAEYRAYLPGGAEAGRLSDLIFLALGRRVETEIRLGLPAHLAEPVRLGRCGQLGWTGWIAPPEAGRPNSDRMRFDARYTPPPPTARRQTEDAAP